MKGTGQDYGPAAQRPYLTNNLIVGETEEFLKLSQKTPEEIFKI